MKIIVGNTAEGENFFGRLAELAHLDRLLEDHHVLLLAPRRVGKSSLLRAYRSRARTDGTVVVYADVQDARPSADAEPQFVRTVLDAIYATAAGKAVRPGWWSRWRATRTSRIKQLQLPGGAGAELEHLATSWQHDADLAFARILEGESRWIVMIDELPNVVAALAEIDVSGGRARAFLAWFRALRNRCADKLHFVVCGSIGLDNVARRLRCTDTINDLCPWTIGAFSAEDADAFLVALGDAYGAALSPDVRAAIAHELEWLIPHHLQAMAQELVGAGSTTIDVARVAAATVALLANRTYFNTWDERLTASLGVPHDDHARAILIACARDREGVSRNILGQTLLAAGVGDDVRPKTLAWLIDVLVHDGYLVLADDRYRFRSALLRRYWLRNFV
ncbi:MAG: ATP-binding protein [Myxococcales bacterium]|nr:ATP-binding protein [Myxococcales bacterium]